MRYISVVAVALGVLGAACGSDRQCGIGLVPNDTLQACVTLPPCDGGVVNERNECVARQEDAVGGDEDAVDSHTDDDESYSAGRSGASGSRVAVNAGDGGAAGRSGRAGAGGASGAAAAGGQLAGSGAGVTGERAGSGGAGASLCGNGKREGNELCDGDCPASCDASANACVLRRLSGSAASCDAKCETLVIDACKSGDGCCPEGCTHATDTDCSVSCGDGVVTAPEKCEPGSKEKPCPTLAACDDRDPCTKDTVIGSACSVECLHAPLTRIVVSCDDGDPCTDDTPVESATSCSYECPHTRKQPTSANCVDNDPCTDDTPIMSTTSCGYECPRTLARAGTDCGNGRMCTADGICKAPDPVCGNGKVEPPEECDPSAPGSTPFNCSKLCRKQTVYTPCKSNSDCLGGTVCGLEMCTRACDGIEDCDYVTEFPSLQLWCPQPRGTQCVIRCGSDFECPPDTSCNGGGYCQGP